MAESYYPAPAVTQLQHERLLGRAMPSGLLGDPSDQPLIYADGTGTREIRVRASRQAIVEGYGWQNDAVAVTKTLAANSSGSSRVDLVVLRLNRADWSLSVQVVQGTPGAGAPSATRTASTGAGSGVWEMELATVTVANGATTLAASTVTEKAWYLGEDGQILCKSTTRPPHQVGRTAFETDTSRWILSDGTNWTNAVDDSGITSVSLQSGYTASLNRVQRRNGTAVLALEVSRTSGLGATAVVQAVKVGQMPAGFFPTFEVPGSAQYESSAGLSMGLRVTTTGGVYVDVPASVQWNANKVVTGSLTYHAA
jgi:hypothetical protein